jgi:hypothetical protein
MGHQPARLSSLVVVRGGDLMILLRDQADELTEDVYLSYPRRNQTEYGILYLTDIFGNALVNNKLYVSSTTFSLSHPVLTLHLQSGR